MNQTLRLAVTVGVAVSLLCIARSSDASVEFGPTYVSRELVVSFRTAPVLGTGPAPLTSLADVNDLFAEFNVTAAYPVEQGTAPRTFRLVFQGDGLVQAAVEAFSSLAEVRYAEPNYLVRVAYTPDDPLLNQQWNFSKVNVSPAWDRDLNTPKYGGDPSVIIAVIDTGVAFQSYLDPNPAFCFVGGDENGDCVDAGAQYAKAPDFSGTRFTSGYDFVNNDSHPNDDNGHGTHVAGTIAEATNNSLGAAGIAFNSTIMPVKVIARDGLGTTSAIAAGVDYARTHGADVINLSLGSSTNSQVLADAIAAAQAADIIVVAATGNAGASSVFYPARLPGVVAVGATGNTSTNARTAYSNYGTGIDLVAPGGEGSSSIIQQSFSNINEDGQPSDFTSFGYIGYQGTSMAAPHVSAALGLILASGASSDDAITALHESAHDLGTSGYDAKTGYGLLDMNAALAFLRADAAPPVTTVTVSPAKPNGLNGYYTKQPTLKLAATDDLSGVASTWYRWDTNAFVRYSGTVRASEGAHRFQYYSRDSAGNRELTHKRTIRLDTKAPSLVIRPKANGGSVSSRRYTVRGETGDTGSGLASVRVNNQTAVVSGNTFSATITLKPGLNLVTVRATDRAGLVRTATDQVVYKAALRLVASPLSGHSPEVRQFRTDQKLHDSFLAYAPTLVSGVLTASGDVDGDGKSEIVTVPASGASHVRVFDSVGRVRSQFFAYGLDYRGSTSVATCDVDNNGTDEIVVGTGPGHAAHVRVLDSHGRVRSQFFAFPLTARIGATVACGDVTGDGIPEIVVVPAQTAGAQVRFFSTAGRLRGQFFAFSTSLRLRLNVAVGDVNGDGAGEVIVAPSSGGAPLVRVFQRTGRRLSQFYALNQSFYGGVQLAMGDWNNDGTLDILTGAGPGGGPQVRMFTGRGHLIDQFFVFDLAFRGGVSVGTYSDHVR